jgi:hypothetical protein
MTSLPHSLNRSLLICANRETVFRFFTNSERFAKDGRIQGVIGIW